MPTSLPNPSSRLRLAAQAEQADLARHRERLARERDRLLGELRTIDETLATLNRRFDVLAELAGPSLDQAADEGATSRGGATTDQPAGSDGGVARGDSSRPVLRGPAIREAAIRILVTQREPVDALHYRRWYKLVLEAGFSVAGKDPLAVFLTQLSRSPLVRKTSTPGVYEVDRQASIPIVTGSHDSRPSCARSRARHRARSS